MTLFSFTRQVPIGTATPSLAGCRLPISHCYGSLCSADKGKAVPKFTVLSRVDAYVDYTAEVEADSPEEAAEIAYEGGPEIKWIEQGTVEFDAARVVTLDAHGEEIESTVCGKG